MYRCLVAHDVGVWRSAQEGAEEALGGAGGDLWGSADAAEERRAHQQWQGPATTFMRSNDHTRERKQRWDPTRVQGTALTIVEGDRDAPKYAPPAPFCLRRHSKPS